MKKSVMWLILLSAFILMLVSLSACSEDSGGSSGGDVEPDGDYESYVPPDTTEVEIDASGGEVANDEGVRVVIPSGAIDTITALTIAKMNRKHLGAYERASSIWRFGPAGTTFAKPVQIEIPYDETLLAGNQPAVYWTKPDNTNLFDEITDATFTGGVASFEVTHFSFGFVGYRRTAAGGGGNNPNPPDQGPTDGNDDGQQGGGEVDEGVGDDEGVGCTYDWQCDEGEQCIDGNCIELVTRDGYDFDSNNMAYVSSIQLPPSDGDAACCFDVNGDGLPDNQVADLFNMLADMMPGTNLDINEMMTRAVEAGVITYLAEFRDLPDSMSGHFDLMFHRGNNDLDYNGVPDAPWANRNAGLGNYEIRYDAFSDDYGPLSQYPDATIANGFFTTNPSSFQVFFPLGDTDFMTDYFHGDHLNLTVRNATLQGSINRGADGIFSNDLAARLNGEWGGIRLGGYVSMAEIYDQLNAYMLNCPCAGIDPSQPMITYAEQNGRLIARCEQTPNNPGANCEEDFDGWVCSNVDEICTALPAVGLVADVASDPESGVLDGGSIGMRLSFSPATLDDANNPFSPSFYAADDHYAIDEGAPTYLFNVTVNDMDAIRGFPQIQSITQPESGATVRVMRNGTRIAYRPPEDFAGVDTFTYTIAEGENGTATVTVDVANSPDNAIANNDIYNLDLLNPDGYRNMGGVLLPYWDLPVLENDYDPDPGEDVYIGFIEEWPQTERLLELIEDRPARVMSTYPNIIRFVPHPILLFSTGLLTDYFAYMIYTIPVMKDGKGHIGDTRAWNAVNRGWVTLNFQNVDAYLQQFEDAYCNGHGSLAQDGSCICDDRYDGASCDECAEGFYPYPQCNLWVHSHGSTSDDEGYDVATDPTGNVYVTGRFRGTIDFGNGFTHNIVDATDIFLTKFDDDGHALWSKAWSGTPAPNTWDRGKAVATDADGNVYLCGQFRNTINFGGGNLISNGQGDIFIAKFNEHGLHQWSKSFGAAFSDICESVAVDPSGNVWITGSASGAVDFGGGLVTAGSWPDDIIVAKFDSTGAHLFSDSFGNGASSNVGTDIITDSHGNAIMTGYYTALPPGFVAPPLPIPAGDDIFVVKFDPTGAIIWSKGFGDIGDDHAYSVAVDSNDNIVVTGEYDSATIDFSGGAGAPHTGLGGNDVFLLKLDEDGNYLWSQTHGGDDSDEAQAVAIDADDNIVIVGSTWSSPGNFGGSIFSPDGMDIFSASYDSDGNHRWSHWRWGSNFDMAFGVTIYDGFYYSTGYFESFVNFGQTQLNTVGGDDIFLVKGRMQ